MDGRRIWLWRGVNPRYSSDWNRNDAQVLLLEEKVDEVLERRVGGPSDFDSLATAYGALGLLLVLERVRVDALVSGVHPAKERCVSRPQHASKGARNM
mgnify:CR=1 FL=1